MTYLDSQKTLQARYQLAYARLSLPDKISAHDPGHAYIGAVFRKSYNGIMRTLPFIFTGT
jgi:hypothetical protein